MPKIRTITAIRCDSKGQLDRFKRAAVLRRWSLNTFLLAAADELADRVLNEKPPDTPAEQQVIEVTSQER